MWACSIAHFNFLVLLMFVPRWKPSCQVVLGWTNRRPLVEPASAKAPASPAGPQHTLRIALLVLFHTYVGIVGPIILKGIYLHAGPLYTIRLILELGASLSYFDTGLH